MKSKVNEFRCKSYLFLVYCKYSSMGYGYLSYQCSMLVYDKTNKVINIVCYVSMEYDNCC